MTSYNVNISLFIIIDIIIFVVVVVVVVVVFSSMLTKKVWMGHCEDLGRLQPM